MSNTTTYINFSSIDYKNENSLSSYALELTPLIFYPDLDKKTTSRLVWDFGDGTTTTAYSASKHYTFPGTYNVNLIIYDCDTNAKISTFEKSIVIKDYIPFTHKININGRVITEDGNPMISEDGDQIIFDIIDDLKFKVGSIEGPIIFTGYFPPYQSVSNIFYSVSGSNSINYWNLSSDKFNHLQKYNTFYKKNYNYLLSSYEYEEIPYITLSGSDVYARVKNSSIERCSKDDPNAKVVGKICEGEAYFKDDSISDEILIQTWFDKTNNDVTFYNKSKVNYLNNLGITLSAKITDNPAYKLSITSNGLDGEKYISQSFNISPIKFSNTEIPFVVKIKDVDNTTVKNFNNIQLSSLNITLSAIGDVVLLNEGGQELLDESGSIIYGSGLHYLIPSENYNIYKLNDPSGDGFFRGFVKFTDLSDPIYNVTINIITTLSSDQLSTYTLTGQSNKFNVYNKNFYDLYKKDEDFSSSKTIQDLIFQESMMNKPRLFEDFIGGVLGNENLNHEDIGVKIYEKISNFVNNTQNLDTCEVDYLNSISDYLDYDDIGEEIYIYPEKVKRIINLASINKNSLVGELNKFNENFDIKGRSSKLEYGKNIGDKIDVFAYMVDKNMPIVALEKFSNTYIKINTYQPSISLSSNTYPLSSYNDNWGWPLVLPKEFNINEIDKYYAFFSFVDDSDDTPTGGVVDYNNTKTNIDRYVSNASLYGKSGVFDHMILDTLYQALSIVK